MVSKASLQIGKEISQLRHRLSVRVSNVEARGLASESTNEARELIAESSVVGKTFRERQSIKRQLKQMLNRETTKVSGAIRYKRVEGKLNLNAEKIIQNTINITSKTKRKRVSRLLSQSYKEIYEGFRDRHWRYQVRELINKAVKERRTDKTILKRLYAIADDIQNGDFDEAEEKFNLKF